MSIRLRLTLWYTAILFVALSVFAVVIYMGLARSWRNDLETTIRGRAQEARAQITVLTNGTGVPLRAYVPEQERLDGFARDGVFIQYTDADGTDKRHSTNLGASLNLSPDEIAAIKRGQGGFEIMSTATGERLTAYLLPLQFGSDPPFGAVITAKATAPLARSLRKAQYFLSGGVLAATLLLALIVYAVAKTALRPIERMARDAAGIQQAQDLSRRVAVPQTGDEVAGLGQTFNGMLGRLEAVFEAQRRFIADASHDSARP